MNQSRYSLTPTRLTSTTLVAAEGQPWPSPWECEAFYRKVEQGRPGGHKNNCPPEPTVCLAICRVLTWHIHTNPLARTHRNTHSHLLTHICFHMLFRARGSLGAPLDRWLPSKPHVGGQAWSREMLPDAHNTTTRWAPLAEQHLLQDPMAMLFRGPLWCGIWVSGGICILSRL